MAITKTLILIGNIFGLTLAGAFVFLSNLGDVKQIVGGLYLAIQGVFYIRKMYWDAQLKKIEFKEREYELQKMKERDGIPHVKPAKKISK